MIESGHQTPLDLLIDNSSVSEELSQTVSVLLEPSEDSDAPKIEKNCDFFVSNRDESDESGKVLG